MKRYYGVDLHRSCFTVCELREDGRERMSTWKLERLAEFAGKLGSDDEVAVEVTGNSRRFCGVVAKQAGRVVLVNPHQFKVISASVSKTDEHDAKRLAVYLAKGMLPEVRMKEETYAEVASLTQTRDKLVKLRTVLKNKINNLLSARGINLKKESLASEKGLQAVTGYEFGPAVNIELQVLVDRIRSLNRNIAQLEKAIADLGSKLPGFRNISSIKGIGPTGGSILLSVIGRVEDFAHEGKLASYFGIVPRVSQSSQTLKTGHITKQGNKPGRTALIQCALIASKYSRYLKDYYERIKNRRGTGKAIVALARKFLTIIYWTLKNGWIWKDFANGELAETPA